MTVGQGCHAFGRGGEILEISHRAATVKGPGNTFTGEVWIDPVTRGPPASALSVAVVRFTPGARSAWHSHDGGQTLYVTEGAASSRPAGSRSPN